MEIKQLIRCSDKEEEEEEAWWPRRRGGRSRSRSGSSDGWAGRARVLARGDGCSGRVRIIVSPGVVGVAAAGGMEMEP